MVRYRLNQKGDRIPDETFEPSPAVPGWPGAATGRVRPVNAVSRAHGGTGSQAYNRARGGTHDQKVPGVFE